jgi:AAA family ATP:ADP antiporter
LARHSASELKPKIASTFPKTQRRIERHETREGCSLRQNQVQEQESFHMSETRQPGALDRFLAIFGDVRAGEGATVILMSLNVFLLLIGYYVLKTVREPLILMAGGAQLKSYAAAAQALTLIIYVPVYGWVASRLPRQRFLMAVILFFVLCIQLFFFGSRIGVPYLGFAFFVWVGIFSLTTIAQFWSYANEIYDRADGDRLFPLIAVGSAAGAPLGAALAGWLFGLNLSPFLMMEIAAGFLLLHLGLYKVVSRRVAAGAAPAREPMKRGNGFGLVFKSRYLRLIALFLVLLNIVNTVGEYILGQAVVTTGDAQLATNPGFNKEAFIGSFYGKYFFWTNVATILIQAFVVSRIVKRFGMRGVLLALPFVALGAYGLAAVGAGLSALLYVKIAENSTDYSVMNTGKQMVWLPTSREEKYNAKQAIDTFFVRSGDMLAAGVVFLGTNLLSFGVPGFARANIAVVLIAIGVAVLLLREYRRLTTPVPAQSSTVAPATV